MIDNPDASNMVFYLATAGMSITVLIGAYFVANVGLLILPLGLVGILIILTYTRWLNRGPFLRVLAPGLGLGPLMVVGTPWLRSEYPWCRFFWRTIFFCSISIPMWQPIEALGADTFRSLTELRRAP